MVSAALGGTSGSPFSVSSGTTEFSQVIPYNYPSAGAGAYVTGAIGSLAGSYPIVFYSYSQYFTAVSANVTLKIGTTNTGTGGAAAAAQTVTATTTWTATDATSPLHYFAYARTSGGTTNTFYYGHVKNDGTTVTFRRGASPGTGYNPNGIWENGVLDTGAWAGTAIGAAVAWGMVPNAPSALTGTSTTAGQVDLTWTFTQDNNIAYGVYAWRILYKKSSDSTWSVYGTNTEGSPSATNGLATRTASVYGLDEGVSYDFRVAGLSGATDIMQSATSVYEYRQAGNYTNLNVHTGSNSPIATVTTAARSAVTKPKFAIYNGSSFVPATVKAQASNGSANFTTAKPWVFDPTVVTNYPNGKWTRAVTATGGRTSIYYDSSTKTTYQIHTFTSSGEFIITEGNFINEIEYLIVGGGGGGGARYMGGGGGGGGVLSGTISTLGQGSYSITVGAAGTGGGVTYAGSMNGGDTGTRGDMGGNSSFNGLIAYGGGGGGSYNAANYGNPAGKSGGSGGGTSGYQTSSPAAGVSGQGNAGGVSSTGNGGAGGGGAGGVGSNGGSGNGGDGGAGVANSITGTSTYYGAGGGGGSYNTTYVAQGGSGVGGNGAKGPNTTSGGNPTSATGYGNGGGGANGYNNTTAGIDGANGSQGIVIIRYPIYIGV